MKNFANAPAMAVTKVIAVSSKKMSTIDYAGGADAEALRDLVAHLDDYAVGEGRRQTGEALPQISERYLSTLIYWGDGGGTFLSLGDEEMNLRSAAAAAIELAHVVEQVRANHLRRAGEEANAAFRRQHGLEPDA
jgi:hypothetical protein